MCNGCRVGWIGRCLKVVKYETHERLEDISYTGSRSGEVSSETSGCGQPILWRIREGDTGFEICDA